MVKRHHHTATAIAVGSSQVVVVVFGGVDEYIRHDEAIRSDTVVLEFGNEILIIGSHPHIEFMHVFLLSRAAAELEW